MIETFHDIASYCFRIVYSDAANTGEGNYT